MSDLTLYQLPPSPNNSKVRIALGLRGIPCKLVDVDLADRAEVVRLSGQPLLPVLQDGERVVFDSHAILRYLDANFPGGPRLYSPERETMRAIERWELFARTQLGEVAGLVFSQIGAQRVDGDVVARANALLGQRGAEVERALAANGCLTGPEPNAADVTVAAWCSIGTLAPDALAPGSIPRFFAETLRLPEDLVMTHAWVRRMVAYDCARRAVRA